MVGPLYAFAAKRALHVRHPGDTLDMGLARPASRVSRGEGNREMILKNA
jgi:hypothetical protein